MAQSTPTPTAQGYRGSSQTETYRGAFSDLANEIDAFWADTFAGEGISYASPDIVVVETATQSACGLILPHPNAFYCRFDRTIYLVPQFLINQQEQFGDYAPITVLSHEWGHHVQTLLGVEGPTWKDFELQADCLMGVFTCHADEEGFLDYGDFMEALRTSEEAGDQVFLPEDAPGAHGQPEERVKALSRGFGGGPVTGCELPLDTTTPTPSPTPRPTVPPNPSAVLPGSPPLAHASCFRIEDEGGRNFKTVAERMGTADATAQLAA